MRRRRFESKALEREEITVRLVDPAIAGVSVSHQLTTGIHNMIHHQFVGGILTHNDADKPSALNEQTDTQG
jgi:hypothetical protein